MLRRERREKRVEIERRRCPIGVWIATEPEFAAHLRRLCAELVRLTVLVDLLPSFGVLPAAKPILHTVVSRRRLGEIGSNPAEAVPPAVLDVVDLGDRFEFLNATRAPSRESGSA